MRCLGTPQHLKNRFGAGYGLELRLRSESADAEAVAFVHRLCPAATLTQRNGPRLSFRIPQHVRPRFVGRVSKRRRSPNLACAAAVGALCLAPLLYFIFLILYVDRRKICMLIEEK
jgi:hypothetical protein